MTRLLHLTIVVAALAGCASQTEPPPQPPPQPDAAPLPADSASSPAPADFPINLRWGLVPKWIAWSSPNATVSWPPNDGCANPPEPRTLRPGTMIDRFGSDSGNVFNARGESFGARAVPFVCRQTDYRVYRVVKPIAMRACQVAPWFDQPGGATQFQSSAPASSLVADGRLEEVSAVIGGGGGPFPQCARP